MNPKRISMEEISIILHRIEEDVSKVKRGLYGDPDNKIKGLIETTKDLNERTKHLEDIKKKAFWIGGFTLVLIELTIQLVKII